MSGVAATTSEARDGTTVLPHIKLQKSFLSLPERVFANQVAIKQALATLLDTTKNSPQIVPPGITLFVVEAASRSSRQKRQLRSCLLVKLAQDQQQPT